MNRLKYFTALALVLPLYGNPAQAYTAQKFSPSSSIMQMIYSAATEKDTAKIHNLLARGYSIDVYDERGYTALCEAIVQGNDEAYDFLAEQGADEKASCVEAAEDEHSSVRNAKILRYGGTTLLLGGLVGGAFAMSSGGGSGGSSSSGNSSSGSGTSTVTFTPGSNGEVDSSQDWSTAASAVLDTAGNVENYYTADELRSDDEFNAYKKSQTETVLYEGSKYDYSANSVNYLDAINAAPAFAKYYGTDADGNFASSLSQNVKLGIIDTGVWGSHSEFQTSEGSKISGYNYDYGPCLNDDTTNCWKASGEVACDNKGKCAQSVVLLDGDGDETEESAVSCDTGSSAITCNPYNVWASGYPEGYDWDNLTYYFYPNNVNDKITEAELDMDESEVLHGTHVTGIMVSNKDGKGNMGILPANATVSAVRWDFMSSLYYPLMKMLSENVVAVNMSLGSEADADSNASQAVSSLKGYSDSGELEAYKAVISSYKDKTNSYTNITGKDGMIIVKAAGNESYSEPDLESGIKLNSEYSDLMMLVVVSVDVSISDGTVTDYSLSGFSNQCGSTSSYCIAAPGGNEVISGGTISDYLLYSAGEVADGVSSYTGKGGTSQATPLVTGSIGFLKAAYPYMSSSEIIDLILETANSGASDYSAAKYGAGLLDLGAAVSTYLSDSGEVTTTASASLSGEKISLSSSRLSVPATFKSAVRKALPKTITAFDKYARPFAFSTANYVSSTHSGYRNLKNDVFNISRRKKLQKVDNGTFSFAFSGSAQNAGGQGLGFASAEYKNGANASGFYFSENTKYGADEYVEKGLNNPFMSFNSAYGVYNTFAFNENSALKIEAVTGRNGLYDGDRSFQDDNFRKQAYALNAELQLHKGKKFGFGLSSGILYEDDALLGMNGDGAFALNSGSTYNTGVTAQWFVTPRLTLSGSYFTGFTKADSFASNLLRTSNLVSESFALDANYRFDKTLDFGLMLSSPLRVRSGTLSIDFPAGRDSYSDEVYRERLQTSLKPEAREYKISAYFNKELTEKLSLRSEAGVRINPDHQRTDSDYRILFGMSWDFN